MAADWMALLRGAQNLVKLERSSGFRPYLIFLAFVLVGSFALLCKFPENNWICAAALTAFLVSVLGFIALFSIKAMKDPDFCRSEKHVEVIKRLEIMEQKGDSAPQLINPASVLSIPNPEPKKLTQTSGDQ